MMTGRPVIQHSLTTIDSVEKELIFFRECRSFCHFVIGPAEHCRTTVVYSLLRSQMSRIHSAKSRISGEFPTARN